MGSYVKIFLNLTVSVDANIGGYEDLQPQRN